MIKEETQFMVDKGVVVFLRDFDSNGIAFNFPAAVMLGIVWNDLTRLQEKLSKDYSLPSTVTPDELPSIANFICCARMPA